MTDVDISAVPVELWDVDAVKPYPYNHKVHPEKQIEILARSIKAQGLLDPIAIDEEGVVISGHGRLEAIKRLKHLKVPVRVLRGLTEDQASALRIAANKTVSNEYDTDMLSRELSRLNEGDFDLSILGIDQRELDMLVSDVGEIDTGSIVDDMDIAIGIHEEDIDERASAADEDSIRLDKAFGFKTVPLPAQRVVTRFMGMIEQSTGKTGAEALIAHMQETMKGKV